MQWLESIQVPARLIATLTNGRDGVLRNGVFLLNATSAEVTDAFGAKDAESLDLRVLIQQLRGIQKTKTVLAPRFT